MNATDADLWEDLLLAVEEGQVVPIVGRDLLTIPTADGPVALHHLVATKLAADLKVPTEHLPANFDTHDVICAYDGFHGDPIAVNPRVVRILKALRPAIPESLRLLAEIQPLKLFVSTTYDTLLDEALLAVRGKAPAVVAFPPASGVTDIDDDLIERHGSLVFQILGRASASASFALTEGQVLEQMHDFMSSDTRPERLVARLRESRLLILGVHFPDWLGRFLLRLARGKPLWDSRPMMEVIVETGAEREAFASFVRLFSPQQSRILTANSPHDIVAELHRRWFERHPKGASSAPAEARGERPAPMSAGAVFISYASEDRPAAFRMADHLSDAGLDVWVDRRLAPGADYRDAIERHIRECSAFVPVLSRHTQTEDERWFRKEWALACDRARLYFGTDRSLIFPVVVDGSTPANLAELRRETFGRSAVSADEGVPDQSLVAELDRAQKAWRRQFAR